LFIIRVIRGKIIHWLRKRMNTAGNNSAVLTKDLTKSFGPVNAVNGLNLAVERGEMFGLVGPDGAGKSTTIRMLCGLLNATSGRGWVAGFDLEREKQLIKSQIGYLSQNFTLYGDLTVDENLEFFARIHGVKKYAGRREELLEFTRLTPFRGRLAEALSGGMKKKLALACTLIHTPRILFLDEPSTGVDPVSRGELWSILSAILDQGITVFMTTPYLDEADRCHRVGLIHRGRLIMLAAPDEIKKAMPGAVYDLQCDDITAAYRLLRAQLPATKLVLYGDRLRLWTDGGDRAAGETVDLLRQANIRNATMSVSEPSLEDAFVALVEQNQFQGKQP
jgi:ABC-2 type transport system ATP-binding protein